MIAPGGSVRCCLCKGFVSTASKERFKEHMANEHNTFFSVDFLLAACQLAQINPTDFGIVRQIMQAICRARAELWFDRACTELILRQYIFRLGVSGMQCTLLLIQGMYEENLRSVEEEVEREVDTSSDSMASLATTQGEEAWKEEEEADLVIDESEEERPLLELPSYPAIPSHLITEFEKLCDKTEDDEAGFEPSLSKPEGLRPCKMLKTGTELVKRSLSMRSFKGVLGSSDDLKEGKSKTFDCPHCEKKFQLSFLLKKHISNNHKDDKNPHPCPFCKKTFRFSILLRRHVQYKHKENNPTLGRDFSSEKEEFPCGLCGKTFTQQGNMKRHMKTIHGDAPVFDCDECGKSFHQSNNLKRHKLSHENVEEEEKKVSLGDLRVFTESLV